MIRFIDLKKQYYGMDNGEDEFEDSFAFIDTVVDRFVDVGGNQFWDSWDDFAEDYNGWRGMELERFRGLVDKKFFRPKQY